MKFTRIIAALALPVVLSGCFMLPGAFTSSLDLRKDGSFTYNYSGEVLMQTPEDSFKGKEVEAEWEPERAKCSEDSEPSYDEPFGMTSGFEGNEVPEGSSDAAAADGAAEAADVAAEAAEASDVALAVEAAHAYRPCKPAEIAKLKKEFDARKADKAAKKKKDAEEFSSIFGFNPSDDKEMAALAARLTRYQGWKSASYKGEGVFVVDYQLSGKLGHDYVFPILPEGNIILPFVTVRKREGGKIFVHAPAFSANGFMGTAARMKGANPFGGPKSATSGRTKGSFTITTNGEVLTNNTEDGPVPDKAGRKISWQVGPGVEKIPEALIQLNP